jgi:DNA-binding MarR family transcriptional regulator
MARLALLERALVCIYDQIERRAAKEGIFLTAAQLLILARMGDAPVPVAIVAAEAPMSSNITYNLNALAGAGYLLREQHSRDRRSRMCSLTESGRAVRAMVIEVLGQNRSVLEAAA